MGVGVPVSIEPILGWRLWQIRQRHGAPTLLSWSGLVEWTPQQRIEARCLGLSRRPSHAAPAREHGCGIYALRERVDVDSLLGELPAAPGDDDPVALGRVSLWGRVIEGEYGWRAQYAYPYDLMLIGGDAALATALRSRYAVDVEFCPDPAGTWRVAATLRAGAGAA